MARKAKQSIPEEISVEEWWRLNAALANYEGSIGDNGKVVSAFAHLVCQAMVSAPLQVLTMLQILDLVRDQFGAKWYMGEVKHAVRELENGGYVQKITTPEENRFTVKDEFRDVCSREQREAVALRDKVLEKWVVEIRGKHARIGDVECKILVEDLVGFIVAVFDRHGAECAALLYYGEAKKEAFIKKMEEMDLPSLRDRGELNQLRDSELLNFFRKAKDDRAMFIGYFLRSSFLKNAITIDPRFIGAISKQFEGSIVVLDTNFIFALLGLQEDFEKDVAKAILQFNHDLGIKSIVHRISIREFQRSLERRGRSIKSLVMPSRELAGALAKAIELKGPIGAYYKRYADTGVKWDDWIQPFLSIEAMLEEAGIEVTDIYEEAIEKDKKLEEETNRIYEVSKEYVERVSGGQPLNIEICRHDAFLRLFSIRLRKGKPNEFMKAGAWCVTLDSKLPRYERLERHRLRDVPVFVLTELWMQYIGPMAPKTEDWNALARSLLLSPYLMVTMPSAPSTERIHRTAARIAEYKDFNPQLATRILLNARFQESIIRLKDDEFNEKVGEVIEEALLEEYYEKDKQLELSIEQSSALSKEIDERKKEEKRLEESQEQLKGEITSIGRLNRITYAISMGLLMLFVGVSLDWEKLSQVPFVLAVIGMIGGATSILGLLLNWRTALKLFLVVATIVSLGAAILAFRTI